MIRPAIDNVLLDAARVPERKVPKVRRRKNRPSWYAHFRCPLTNRRHHWKMGDTRKSAQETAEAIAAQAMLFKRGVITRAQYARAVYGNREIDEILADFEKWLGGRQVEAIRVRAVMHSVRHIISEAGITCLDELQARRVEVVLDEVANTRSVATRNEYLQRIKQLSRWASRRGMLDGDPLQVIERMNADRDRRRVSRALTFDEVDTLLEATPCPIRRAYYLVAVRTGLRWGEIAALTWGQVDWENGWLVLRAEDTKSGRADELPLSTDVMEALVWLRESDDLYGRTIQVDSRIFPTTPTLRTWKKDLERAGIPFKTPRGNADRKALRKTFVTHLALTGVDIRTAQRLARHTDINLTSQIYTDRHLLDLKGAVEGLSRAAGVSPHGEQVKQETA